MIDRLDHLVLTVRNLDATCAFYVNILEMRVVISPNGRRALHFGQQKINLHEAGHEFEPKARLPTPGSGDLCFITGSAIEDVMARLSEHGVAVELGPVPREGALGQMDSVYFRDPDGNLIEVSRYR